VLFNHEHSISPPADVAVTTADAPDKPFILATPLALMVRLLVLNLLAASRNLIELSAMDVVGGVGNVMVIAAEVVSTALLEPRAATPEAVTITHGCGVVALTAEAVPVATVLSV
jgi:hypothetical protein